MRPRSVWVIALIASFLAAVNGNGNGNESAEIKPEEINNAKSLTERLTESVTSGQEWLWSTTDSSGGWGMSTVRVITALGLTESSKLNHRNDKTSLAVKVMELHIALALARGEDYQLSLFVNALLSICAYPDKFYNFDLVERLEEYANKKNFLSDYAEALTYLALCNAGVDLDKYKLKRLRHMLENSRETPRLLDYPAMAVLALSCSMKNNQHPEMGRTVNRSVKFIKKQQEHFNGSFGNIYTSALVLQALTSAKTDEIGWNSTLAKEYILSQQNSDGSFESALAGYFALPALYGKSLASISEINCNRTGDLHNETDIDPDIRNETTTELLVVGIIKEIENETVAKTFTGTKNASFYDMLNETFKCTWKETAFGPMLNSVDGLEQDAENRKYWALYQRYNTNNGQSFRDDYLTKGADKVYPKDGSTFILKYESY